VREGDSVNAGDIIAILDDAQIRAREAQAQAALSGAEDKGDAARQQIAVLQQQLDQSQLQVGQSKFDTEGHVHQAEAELAAAQSDLVQQQAAYQIAAFDKEAYTRLAKSGAVSERQGLQAAPPPISRPPWLPRRSAASMPRMPSSPRAGNARQSRHPRVAGCACETPDRRAAS